jgi:hypothetical protein
MLSVVLHKRYAGEAGILMKALSIRLESFVQPSILTSDASPFISTPLAADIHSTLLHLLIVSSFIREFYLGCHT